MDLRTSSNGNGVGEKPDDHSCPHHDRVAYSQTVRTNTEKKATDVERPVSLHAIHTNENWNG